MFNRFCRSCSINSKYVTEQPRNLLDSVCQEYVDNILEKKKHPTTILDNFLIKLQNLNTSDSWIFGLSSDARFLYEELFNETYSFRILVEAAPPSSENCIQSYKDGIGFMNREKERNFTESQNLYYETGKRYEQLYIQSVVYMWAKKLCDKTSNKEFVSNNNIITFFACTCKICIQ